MDLKTFNQDLCVEHNVSVHRGQCLSSMLILITFSSAVRFHEGRKPGTSNSAQGEKRISQHARSNIFHDTVIETGVWSHVHCTQCEILFLPIELDCSVRASRCRSDVCGALHGVGAMFAARCTVLERCLRRAARCRSDAVHSALSSVYKLLN